MNPKIDKNGVLGVKASIGCPCAPLDHQKGGPRMPKMNYKVFKIMVSGAWSPKSSNRVPKPPKENRAEQPKRKELQRTMHTI